MAGQSGNLRPFLSFDRFNHSPYVPAATQCPNCKADVSGLIPIAGGYELHRCSAGSIVTVLGATRDYCTLAWVDRRDALGSSKQARGDFAGS
jgi:hypothetical protein